MATDRNKKAITNRFLEMIEDLVTDGACRSRGAFCEAIGEHPQNLSRMKKGERSPTLEQLAAACERFGYSPTWLILGKGPKKMSESSPSLEKRVAAIEEQLKVLQESK